MRYSVVMPIHQFYPLVGGAEQQAQRLAKNLVARGNRVTVLTGWWDRSTPQRDTIDGIEIYRNSTLWSSFSKFRLLNTLRLYTYEATLMFFLWRWRRSYDLIHVHQALHAAAFSTLVAKVLGKKILIKVGCGGVMSDLKMMTGGELSPFGRQLWSIIKRCDRIVAINREIEEELLADGFSRTQLVRIPNGIAASQVPVKNCYAPAGPVRLVIVGRITHQKGYDVLLEALSRLEGLHFGCEIFGDGEDRGAVEAELVTRGLTGKVSLSGVVDDVPERLNGMDLFVLPSRAEGLSNALMEAMSAGLPCVATNIGGNTDLLEPEGGGGAIPLGEFHLAGNGVLVNPEDPEGLAAALQLLIGDQALRERLGRQARSWVTEHCCLERVTERYLELYDELLGRIGHC